MAASRKDMETKMIIRVQVGTDTEGNPVTENSTISHWNPELTDDEFLKFGNMLGGLQTDTVDSVRRQDEATVVSE